MSDPRVQTFDERAAAVFREATDRALAETPELDAVAVVFLYRYAGVRSALVRGQGGAVVNPDTLLRLMLETGRLQQWLLEQSSAGVEAVRELVANLARSAAHVPRPPDPSPREEEADAVQ